AVLVRERLHDLLAHDLERLRTAGELLIHLDDVEAKRALDDVAHPTGLEGERGGVERRDHLPAREEPEVAALAGRARVLRELLGQLREVAALLHFGEDVLRLLARL